MSFCLYYGGRLVLTISHTAVTLILLVICLLSLAALFLTASASTGPVHLDEEEGYESDTELEIAQITRTSMSSPVSAALKIRTPPRSPTSDQTRFPLLDPGTMV
ncbi:hypothetical protein AURDEDRAFT_147960 [Auricularia subglabra TFB-10046 SS5]|nr:hypothetical protein AURDEDRAFT_147960 [Auricularia subglabra TFB-10046 SS5]